MLYKRISIWIREKSNSNTFESSIIKYDFERVNVTTSGDYLILSHHNDDSTEVKAEVYHLSTVTNWVTYLN